MLERVRSCRVCGCTDDRACPGGCSWIEARLCSACAAAQGHTVTMTRIYPPTALKGLSVATCACGWTSKTPVRHYRKQDAAVRGHWQAVVAEAAHG